MGQMVCLCPISVGRLTFQSKSVLYVAAYVAAVNAEKNSGRAQVPKVRYINDEIKSSVDRLKPFRIRRRLHVRTQVSMRSVTTAPQSYSSVGMRSPLGPSVPARYSTFATVSQMAPLKLAVMPSTIATRRGRLVPEILTHRMPMKV